MIRFQTWYVVDGDWDILRHERKIWKEYTVDMVRKRGTGVWEITVKKGDAVIATFENPNKDVAVRKAREIIAKEEVEK